MNFVNNWSRPIELAAGATSCELDLPDGEYLLTLTDSPANPSRWEIIWADVYEGVADIERGEQGTGDQDWPEGSIVYQGLTAGQLAELFARIAALEDSGGGSVGDGLTKENFADLVRRGYLGSAADNSERGPMQIFNRRELGFMIYGSLAGYVGCAPVYRSGDGPDIEFGPYQKWNLGAAQCAHVYAVAGAGDPYIGLAPGASVFGGITLTAESFGPMYNEIPARSFSFSVELLVPPLDAGDLLTITFAAAGHTEIVAAMDPVTREWSVGGAVVATQSLYASELYVASGPQGSGGHPETAQFPDAQVDLTPDPYRSNSGITISCRFAVPKIIRINRVGGQVVYAAYD